MNNAVTKWMRKNRITAKYCQQDDKKCLGVVERFNRTIKLMIEKYLTKRNSNRWIDAWKDFVENYNSSYHTSIKDIPERLEIFDEVELIRKSIKHNRQLEDLPITRGDFVRLLTKRGHLKKKANDSLVRYSL